MSIVSCDDNEIPRDILLIAWTVAIAEGCDYGAPQDAKYWSACLDFAQQVLDEVLQVGLGEPVVRS